MLYYLIHTIITYLKISTLVLVTYNSLSTYCTDIRDDSPGGAWCTDADFDFVKKEMPFFWKYLRQILRLDSVKPS